LTLVIERLAAANLKICPCKCKLFQPRVTFLGYVVSAEGTAIDPEKERTVREWPTPQSVTEVRSCVALRSYYYRFVSGFAQIFLPLHHMTKKNARFHWGPLQEAAFQDLRTRLTEAPVVALLTGDDQFTLDADASHGLPLNLASNVLKKLKS
jgi:hypothetical protein